MIEEELRGALEEPYVNQIDLSQEQEKFYMYVVHGKNVLNLIVY
jgi:hypothetical protein